MTSFSGGFSEPSPRSSPASGGRGRKTAGWPVRPSAGEDPSLRVGVPSRRKPNGDHHGAGGGFGGEATSATKEGAGAGVTGRTVEDGGGEASASWRCGQVRGRRRMVSEADVGGGDCFRLFRFGAACGGT